MGRYRHTGVATVGAPAFAFDADADVVAFKDAGESAAVVGVEDLRRSIGLDRPIKGIDAEGCISRVRQPPRSTLHLYQPMTATRFTERSAIGIYSPVSRPDLGRQASVALRVLRH